MPIDRAIPLGLIATELITNALKHAFPEDRGQVQVSLESREGGRLTLCVADDGVGNAKPLFRRGGGAGVGSMIVPQLAAQIDAVLRHEDGTGTSISVEVPDPERLP